MTKKQKAGRYQEKKKLGLVPLHYSEPLRKFVTAAKTQRGLTEARHAHDDHLRREYGPGFWAAS